MKIVLFMDNPVIPTGYASTCRLTARELIKRGHEIYALAFNGGGSHEGYADFNGIKVIPNYALSREKNAMYGDAECVIKVFNDVKPDIMFFHNDSYRYEYLKDVPAHILRKSVFWLPFEGDVPDVHGLNIFDKVAATRFVTQHALDIHKKSLKDCDIGVIYHAVDLDNLGPGQDKRALKASKQIGIDDKFVVCRVDRHQPRKYWDRTLKAFAKFAKDKDDVYMLAKCNPCDITMVSQETGDGLDLTKLVIELGISDKVRFDDFFFNDSYMADAFFRASDVFLTTTSGEGFGLCPCEAMACGLPVIYPDTPVMPEVLGDCGIKYENEARIFYEPMHVWHNLASIDDASKKLQWAYDDWKNDGGKELDKLAQKGLDRVNERYSPKVVYDQWDKVFNTIVEQENLVSVITVLYNLQGKDQIFGQDGIEHFRRTMEKYVTTPYEWIIIDNGSPAKEVTREWMAKAANENCRIKPFYSDVNMGFAGANNIGISKAKGKWIVLSNPDSEALDPVSHGNSGDYLAVMVKTAQQDPDIGIVGMEINHRPDVMKDARFPYFCNVLITKKCLDAVRIEKDKWLDESFWPAYYEDLDLCIRAEARGFKIMENKFIPFYHKSGGTNKHAIEGGAEGPYVKYLKDAMDQLSKDYPKMANWDRKKRELADGGMQSFIYGNIAELNNKYGPGARSRIKIVWHSHIGAGVGFSQIVEGLAVEQEKLGFDVYINDWMNKENVENPAVLKLIDKYQKANMADDLGDAIHVVCWLMETFLDVDVTYKIGVSFCESTHVRDSYLKACNGMDRILTFSKFCKNTQINSDYTSPIDVINPGVNPIFLNYHSRPLYKPGWGHEGAKDLKGTPQMFTFLNVGVSQDRKDTGRLVEAFCEAFPKHGDRFPDTEDGFPLKPGQVELVLKSNVFGDLAWVEPHKQRANIRTIFTGKDPRADRGDFSTEEMYDLYCSADAYVHMSHGEGIGMPLCEAAGTGLPLIFTNWSSPSEYFNESNSLPISLSPYPGTTFSKAYPGVPGDNGVWANCNIGHVKHLMLQAIRDRAGTKVLGDAASKHMKENFTWKKTAHDMIPLVFEWERDRAKKTKKDKKTVFDPMTYEKPALEPVRENDRLMIDICTRDRHTYVATLVQSLLTQTFKNWDLTIMCDDADESMPSDHQIMSLMYRCQHEGHGWKIIRGHRQGPHISHDRTLQMTAEDPGYKYKLICRIDDDITLKPDYLENLYKVFLEDEKCEVAAVGGVYLDPKRTDDEQIAPTGFESDINYAGSIDYNVMWPYVCRYPEGTGLRTVEHLYSSFMYRVEVATSIGGYCKRFSQIGHREESDFSYRFHVAGYKQYIQPESVGYHFFAPAGGIRAMDINEKNRLAEMDHKIYEKRRSYWKKRAEQKALLNANKAPLKLSGEETSNGTNEPPKDSVEAPDPLPETPKEDPRFVSPEEPKTEVKSNKIICVINGGDDGESILEAVGRMSEITDEIYVTCSGSKALDSVNAGRDAYPKLHMVISTPDESAILTQTLASEGDHEFVMTVTDTMKFDFDPTGLISPDYDDYVFEVYKTYVPGRAAKDVNGNVVFVQHETTGTVIGPEAENRCLLYRRRREKVDPPKTDRIYFSDFMVIDDERLVPIEGRSIMDQDLIKVSDIGMIPWRKFCTYQYPKGKLKNVRFKDIEPDRAPLVSIIIPTHGRLSHLKRCISSIYSHTTTPYEVIVVDNGSNDGTMEYLEKESWRENFRTVRQQVNTGYQKAINTGVARARGKYLLLFNDDAWIERSLPDGRDWIRGLLDELERDPNVALIGPHGGMSPSLGIDMLFFWCVMMSTDTWKEIGPLDDSTFFNYGGDDDYCYRVQEAGKKVKMYNIFDGTLRHLMSLEPDEEQAPEIEASKVKLLEKYRKSVSS